MRAGPALALLAGLVHALAAPAQWQVAQETVPGAGEPAPVARVTGADGRALAVYRDDDDRIRVAFELGPGLAAIEEETCPSYRVDEEPPVHATFDEDGCLLRPGAAVFSLGRVENNRVDSVLLLAFMNGTELVFHYHLHGLGYHETRFSLRGSKQALRRAIGRKVAVNGD